MAGGGKKSCAAQSQMEEVPPGWLRRESTQWKTPLSHQLECHLDMSTHTLHCVDVDDLEATHASFRGGRALMPLCDPLCVPPTCFYEVGD